MMKRRSLCKDSYMFLTITSSAPQARDLGFVLAKHPDRVHEFATPGGQATVFFPRADDQECSVALLVKVDPIALAQSRVFRSDSQVLAHYINDRPYIASSLLAVTIGKVFRSAMAGVCKERPELVEQQIPLEIHLPTAPIRGGAELPGRLFQPLGWQLTQASVPLDQAVVGWGDSDFVDLRLSGTLTVQQALTHLYVLLPVLDDSKHYWVNEDEIEKLLRAGAGWLAEHPERELITNRYLAHRRSYVTDATVRLLSEDGLIPEAAGEASEATSTPITPGLAQLRRAAIIAELNGLRAASVVDLGCGEGNLVRELLTDPSFTQIIAADVSPRCLARAEKALHLERMPDQVRERLSLLQTSATYRDDRLAGKDAIVLQEVIEHIDLERLGALERSVFVDAAPTAVIITTPNAEYNVLYPNLPAGTKRHPDHRFEWSRTEFAEWANQIAANHGYQVRFEPIGELAEHFGSPTQMAVFTRNSKGGVDE